MSNKTAALLGITEGGAAELVMLGDIGAVRTAAKALRGPKAVEKTAQSYSRLVLLQPAQSWRLRATGGATAKGESGEASTGSAPQAAPKGGKKGKSGSKG